MRSEAAVIAAALALALAGCASHDKQTAASQPAPLSVPQTHVTLPPPQPLDPAALASEADVKAPEKPAEPPAPAEPAVSAAPAAARPPRRPARAVAAQPVPPPAAEPAAQPAPPPVERPPIQAVVPAQEQKKLRALAQARKKEVRATLAKMSSRRLSADDQDLVKRIEFFVAQSDEAERRGDMSQADVFAQRAQDLARGWQGGR